MTGSRLPKPLRAMSWRLGTGMLVVAFVGAALSGCGSDEKPAASGQSSLEGWAQGFCTTVAEWQSSTKSTATKVATSTDDFAEAGAAVTSADNFLVQGLEGLGVPPAPASTAANSALDELSADLEKNSGGVAQAVSGVRTQADIVAASAQVKALISEMNSDISRTVTKLKSLPDTEGWKAAFEQSPMCQGVATG